MKRSIAAPIAGLVLVATLAGAAGALAEPANSAGLKFMAPTSKGALFLANGPGKRTGQTIEFWTLTTFATPPSVGGVPVAAVWLAQKVDCAAKTMVSGESVVLNDKLAVIHREPPKDSPRPVVAGSPGEKLRAHFCDAAPLAGLASTPAANVADAVRLTRTPGALTPPA